MGTFDREYEALCAAMTMLDSAIGEIEDSEADENFGWSSVLNTIRNAMNDARLHNLRRFGPRVSHVEDIPTATKEN